MGWTLISKKNDVGTVLLWDSQGGSNWGALGAMAEQRG